MAAVLIHNRGFVPFISTIQIRERVLDLAARIETDYNSRKPLFIGVLNGSFMFAADLFRALSIDAEITFVKLASYKGTTSSGEVATVIGLDDDLAGRHVIVVEDIVDTGKTLSEFLPVLQARNPASIAIASLLVKPVALRYDLTVNYAAFEIENRFVVGYGLDYDGHGRNLPELYVLDEKE